MSSSNKIALSSKLKYGFSDPHKLQDELFELCERHDALYMLDPESIWKPVQQQKLNDLLASHASPSNAQAALKQKIDEANTKARNGFDSLSQHKKKYT